MQGAQVEQLQIVVPQFDLFAENMGEKVVDVRKDAIGRLEGNRLVTVQETVDLPAGVCVVGNRAEAVVFRNAGQIAFPVVLTQGLDISRDKRLDAPAAAQRLPDPLVDGRSHAQVGAFSFHCFSGHGCLHLESVAHPPRDNGAARRTPREQDNRSWPIATT